MTDDLFVVGLDPSLQATGLALPNGRSTIGSTRTGATWADRRGRYLGIVAKITSAITGHADYSAHRCVILVEHYAFGVNTAGHADVIELGFLLRWHLAPRCAALVEVNQSTLKKYATGRGNAKKPDLRVELLKRAGVDEPDDNRVDAAWLRYMGLQRFGQTSALAMPADRAKVLDAVVWPALKVAA